jgi:TIR domain/Pentapeptide repeats (8 copies)
MDRDEAIKLLKGGLRGIREWNRRRDLLVKAPDLSRADLSHAHLSRANLSGAILRRASLSHANLIDADLSGANLSSANLSGAILVGATLLGTDLRSANLSGADLSGALLPRARLENTNLRGTNLTRAVCSMTIFIDVDLSEAKGLELAAHTGRCPLSIDTLFLSKGKIPDAFLRRCGVPETLITHLPSLIGSMSPIQFYSIFISYSAKDTPFAERLYADLQNKGVRCWYAPEDLKIGEKIRVGIDQSIRVHDKLLLILSKNSVESQ